ncbi:unnamed protein product [Tilletia controversa]|nr:unnamed protein product [Tilletia controversa]
MNCDVDASGLEPIVLKVGRQQSGTFVGSMFDRLLNVSHDCHHHGCKVDIAGAAVRMEREVVTQSKSALVHNVQDPHQQYLLNHCLFRSALSLASFYPPLAEAPSTGEIARFATDMEVDEDDDEDDDVFSLDDGFSSDSTESDKQGLA